MTLRTVPSDRDVKTLSTAFRVDLGTRYVTMCGVSLVTGRSGGKRYMIRRIERGLWGGGGWVGKQWTEKESFQQYFYNRYKILHTCHTYCCYAYNFYAYWLYFIYVWHVYVSPKTYKWFGTFIIKDETYTFTFIYVCSGFNGLEVACWPLVPKFAGSHQVEAVGLLGRKTPQHAFLRRGSKVP
jgi:hypothetical protein